MKIKLAMLSAACAFLCIGCAARRSPITRRTRHLDIQPFAKIMLAL